jgi:hypothetical protein
LELFPLLLQKPRKYYSDLSQEETRLLVKAIINITTKLNKLYEGKKSPKDFARELGNNLKSRKNLAGIFTLYKLDLSPDDSLNSDELDKLLCENFLESVQDDTGDMTTNSEFSEDKSYMKSNRRSEILKVLSDSGLLIHLDEKKEIPEYHGQGKKSLLGRPSSYKVSNEFQQLKLLLSKPQVLELIIKSLESTMVLYNALKYLTISFFYLLRDIEQRELYDAFKSASTKTHEEIRNATIDSILSIKPFLINLVM